MLANGITIGRICLIPAVVGLLLAYAHGGRDGAPDEGLRWAALAVFLLAAASDAVDGYVARHYNQRTGSGALLDPLADKALLVATILTLSFSPWPWRFPLWFPAIVVARDGLSLAGAAVVWRLTGSLRIRPHWSGRAATFLQMCAVCWVLLKIETPHPVWPTALAAAFTVLSGAVYLRAAIRQVVTAPRPGA